MERTYPALVEKEPESDYCVFFPDLPGCVTAGSTFEEAREMAAEALMLHLEGMSAAGEYIPPPSSADAALAHEDAVYAIALIVVEALPERTEEEAQAAFDAFMASEDGQEYQRRIALYQASPEIAAAAMDWTLDEVAVVAETPEREPALAR